MPADLYEMLYKDVARLLTAATTRQTFQASQFERFANFLVSLLCDKESGLLTRAKMQQARVVGSSTSTVLQTQGSLSQWQS